MKKSLLLVFVLIALFANAQTDSTDIKLQHYKDLFIKGLITSQEYEALKQQTLGLPAKTQPTTIIVQQPKIKAEIDSVQAEKFRRVSTSNIVAGSGGLVLGIGLLIGGGVYHIGMQKEIYGQPNVTGAAPNQRLIKQDRIVTSMLCVFGSVATVVGITGISVGVKQKRQLRRYDQSLSVMLGPAGLSLAYNF